MGTGLPGMPYPRGVEGLIDPGDHLPGIALEVFDTGPIGLPIVGVEDRPGAGWEPFVAVVVEETQTSEEDVSAGTSSEGDVPSSRGMSGRQEDLTLWAIQRDVPDFLEAFARLLLYPHRGGGVVPTGRLRRHDPAVTRIDLELSDVHRLRKGDFQRDPRMG